MQSLPTTVSRNRNLDGLAAGNVQWLPLPRAFPQTLTALLAGLAVVLGSVVVGAAVTKTGPHPSPDALTGRVLGHAPAASGWPNVWGPMQRTAAAADDLQLHFLVASQRDGADQVLHDVQRGRAQIGGLSVTDLARAVPELQMLEAPFLFRSLAEVDFILRGHFADLGAELLAASGLRLLGWQIFGWKGVLSDSHLRHPDQIAGRLLKGDGSNASRLLLLGLGARPQQFRPVYRPETASLVEWNMAVTNAQPRVAMPGATHLTLLEHAPAVGVIVANGDWFDGLTDHQQQRLLALGRGSASGGLQSAVDPAERPGVVHRLIAAERAVWREAAQPLRRRLPTQIGGRATEVLAVLEKGKRAFDSRRQPSP